jgi:hypothetical protein
MTHPAEHAAYVTSNGVSIQSLPKKGMNQTRNQRSLIIGVSCARVITSVMLLTYFGNELAYDLNFPQIGGSALQH